MKYSENIRLFLLLSLVLGLPACQTKSQTTGLQSNPFNSPERRMPSLKQEAPEVLAQKMFEADEQAISKLGPRVLRDWLKNRNLLLIDLGSEAAVSIDGAVRSFDQELKKADKGKAIVVFASKSESRKVEKTCRKIRQQGFRNVFMLDGGLEAWLSLYGKR